ncbi:MAG: glycosyltransferase [Desulfovibrionaceae bacterium]|nr:glycosyltransferase [Desulfovibrionaceae bacterium]
MSPLLSVIIPHYNHHEALPNALKSILSQTLKDIEVVIVDDCSDAPCDGIVAEYREIGLNITFVRNEKRKYLKESRLVGVEAAQGRLITFLDADDIFYKNAALEYHVDRLLEAEADIVQFDFLYYVDGVKKQQSPWWAKPLAEDLRGADIFKTYLRGNCGGHTVCGKIVTKKLWLTCLSAARAISVRWHQEDLLLSSLLFLHAQAYIGSSRIGYVYFHNNAAALHKAFGRCADLYAMLTEFLPYMQQQGMDAALCADMRVQLFKKVKENMIKYLEYLYPKLQENTLPPEAIFSEMLEHAEPDMALRVLMTGLMQVIRN